jgi:transposase
MKPLSQDLRERIIAAVDNREGSRRDIARRFQVDVSGITRLLQLRRQTGSLDPRPPGGGKRPTLDHDGLERLRVPVPERPDAPLQAMRQHLNLSGSILIVWRGLRELDITRKKKTRPADERDRPDVQKKRRAFRRKVQSIEPGRLVVVDETGVTTAMTPAYARADRGERAVDSAPASWESIPLIAAVGRDGVRAPLACPGATNESAFQSSVDGVLVPALPPGDVVVFDTLAAHLKPAGTEAIERVGASVRPLPPYSPEDTPIEERFSKVKEFLRLRRVAARPTGTLYETLGETLREVTVQEILGWFRHAGLCATQS